MFGRGLVYAAVFALQSAVMIFITPLTVRSLSKNQFGRLVTGLTIVQLLIVILGFGMGTAIQRFRAEDDESFHKTRALLGTSIVLAVVATALVAATGPWWAVALHVGPYGAALAFAVAAAGLTAIGMLIAQLFRAEDRFGAFCGVMMPLAIGSQVIGLAFVLLAHRTAAAYLAGMCVGTAVGVAFGIVSSRPLVLRPHDRRILVASLALALPLVANGVAYQVLNMGDRIVVQSKLGEFAVGRYQLAYNAAALVILAMVLISQTWLPRLFAIKDLALRKVVLAESRDALYELLVPLILGISLVAPVALRILAPPSYRTDQLLLVVSLVAISAIPFAAYLADTRVLIAFGRTRPLLWATPLAAVFNIALNIAFVPIWGINASAAATVAAYGLLAACSGFAARRVARLSPSPLRVWWGLGATVCLSLLTVVVPTDPLWIVGRVLVASACGVWAVTIVVRLVKGTGTREPRRRPAHRITKTKIGRTNGARRASSGHGPTRGPVADGSVEPDMYDHVRDPSVARKPRDHGSV